MIEAVCVVNARTGEIRVAIRAFKYGEDTCARYCDRLGPDWPFPGGSREIERHSISREAYVWLKPHQSPSDGQFVREKVHMTNVIEHGELWVCELIWRAGGFGMGLRMIDDDDGWR